VHVRVCTFSGTRAQISTFFGVSVLLATFRSVPPVRASANVPSANYTLLFFFTLERERVRREREREREREGGGVVTRISPVCRNSPLSSLPLPPPFLRLSSSGEDVHWTRAYLGHSRISLRLSCWIARKHGEPNEHAPVTVHYRFRAPCFSPFFPVLLFLWQVYARIYLKE